MADEPKEKPTDESLLTEYKLAQEMHVYYGKSLWQIGSIFFAASLAGFAFGLQNDLAWDKFVFLNSFLTILLSGFIIYAKRHGNLAHMYISRCRQIEEKLGMKQHTYKYEIDNKCNEEPIIIAGSSFTKKRITGKHINFIIPLFLMGVFWVYNIYKALT